MRRAATSAHRLLITTIVFASMLTVATGTHAYQNAAVLGVETAEAPPEADARPKGAPPAAAETPLTPPAEEAGKPDAEKDERNVNPQPQTGEQNKDAPKDAKTSPGEVTVTVVSVTGMVQARVAADKPWKPAKVGMKLPQGAEFRTGLRSQVVIVIPPNQKVALDRLGVIKVLQVIRLRGKIKTDIGMKYGRAVYNVEAAGKEHESTIHVPGATLAVRGSTVGVTSQGWIQQFSVRDGTGEFTPQEGQGATIKRKHIDAPAETAAQIGEVIAEMDGLASVGLPGTPEGIDASRTTLNVVNADPIALAYQTRNNNDTTGALDPTEERQQADNPGLNPGGGLGSDFFGPVKVSAVRERGRKGGCCANVMP